MARRRHDDDEEENDAQPAHPPTTATEPSADGQQEGQKKKKVPARQVYVTGFRVATEAQIREFFAPAGGVVAMCNKVGKSKPAYKRETVLCTFKKDKALKKALELNGTSYQNAVIRVGLNVEPVREAKRAEGSERVFVGNLPWDMTPEKVEKMFCRCGTVVFVRFAYDEQKTFRGFCHITFKGTTGVAVEKAMEFDGAEVGGRVLKVGRAEGKKKHTDDPRGKKLGKNRGEGGDQGAGGDSNKTAAGGGGGSKSKLSSGEVGEYRKRSSGDAGSQAPKRVKYFNERDE